MAGPDITKPNEAQPEKRETKEAKNEGEGSRSADEAYRRGLGEFEREGRVEQSAREAEEAVEGREGEELRDAERQGKKGPRPAQKHPS